MFEFIVAIIILVSITSKLSAKKPPSHSSGDRYERTNRSSGNQRSDTVEDSLQLLKQRIEEATGLTTSKSSGSGGYERSRVTHSSSSRKPQREPRQRGGTSPRHRKITSEASESTAGRYRRRSSASGDSTMDSRRAEIAESIAFWDANRAHMGAINDDFNRFIDDQHRELDKGMRDYKVSHRR